MISHFRDLVDCPQPVACTTHAGIAKKLSLYHKLSGVLRGGGGQGQVPQTQLLDKILGLLRDYGRVHQVSG